jgi:hypothetical protein
VTSANRGNDGRHRTSPCWDAVYPADGLEDEVPGHRAAIMAILAIAPKRPADGTGRPLAGFSHRPDAVGLLMETSQRHAFFGLELCVRFGGGLHLKTLLDFRCCTSDLNPPFSSTSRFSKIGREDTRHWATSPRSSILANERRIRIQGN